MHGQISQRFGIGGRGRGYRCALDLWRCDFYARNRQPVALHQDHRRFGAAVDLELFKDVTQMHLDGVRADHQLARDLGIGRTSGEQARDIHLALAERIIGAGAGIGHLGR